MYAPAGFIFLTTHTATTRTDKRSTFGIFSFNLPFQFLRTTQSLPSTAGLPIILSLSFQYSLSRLV